MPVADNDLIVATRNGAPRKVIVAVHGIGDQITYETAQSVAFRFFDYFDVPPVLPLGRFHRTTNVAPGVVIMDELAPPLGGTGFAEMYWANVPRELVTQGYTLEEAKHWARTIVARLQYKAQQSAGGAVRPRGMTVRQHRMLQAVLEELIDAVYVLENLTFLAERAGVFKFDLKKVLDGFLNDVQVVTEFENQRRAILGRFHEMLDGIVDRMPDAEIYVVGHSEGSVVAFLGLLNGMSTTPVPRWVENVRGLMTIGSPIETHVVLWDDLWAFRPAPDLKRPPITWWNYFDYGDPIAYSLVRTKEWLRDGDGTIPQPTVSNWGSFFELHEVAFSRYPLPGKAHVDYWDDAGVFNHFIDEVVRPAPQRADGTVTEKKREPGSVPVPQSKAIGRLGRVVPYVLVAALMYVATFLLYKPVNAALAPPVAQQAAAPQAAALAQQQAAQPGQPQPPIEELRTADTFRNIVGFGWLLAAMSVMVRVPRLTDLRRSPMLWLISGVFIAGAFFSYRLLVHESTIRLIDDVIPFGVPVEIVVALTTIVAALWSHAKPSRGVRPLLTLGCLLVAGIVVRLLIEAETRGDVWPVVLGAIGFLYVWWLSTLLFDLTVVWHTYVVNSGAIQAMRAMTAPTRK